MARHLVRGPTNSCDERRCDMPWALGVWQSAMVPKAHSAIRLTQLALAGGLDADIH
jgi:hypothetical protein